MTRIYAFREANMQDKTVYNNILLNDVHKTFNYYYFGKKKTTFVFRCLFGYAVCWMNSCKC